MKRKTKTKLAGVLIAATLLVSVAGCGAAKAPDSTADETTQSESEAAKDTGKEESAQSEAGQEESKEDAPAEETEKESLVTGENMISNGDFSQGIDPWMTFCQDGECVLEVNSDGELDIDITSIGTVEHGVQPQQFFLKGPGGSVKGLLVRGVLVLRPRGLKMKSSM